MVVLSNMFCRSSFLRRKRNAQSMHHFLGESPNGAHLFGNALPHSTFNKLTSFCDVTHRHTHRQGQFYYLNNWPGRQRGGLDFSYLGPRFYQKILLCRTLSYSTMDPWDKKQFHKLFIFQNNLVDERFPCTKWLFLQIKWRGLVLKILLTTKLQWVDF